MKRDPYMDNLRCLLILLVVVAHFLSKLSSIDEYQHLYYFIYLFHMPLFIFVSGYFSKSMMKDGVFQSHKLISIFWMFLIFKGASYLITMIYKGPYALKLLDEGSAPWYLLSLCLWYLMIPVLHNYKAKVVIPITFLIGILAGMDSSISTFLSLSRTIVFFPFFCMGYYLSKDNLDWLLRKKCKIPAACFLTLALVWFFLQGDLFKPYIRFTYGASSYTAILKEHALIYGSLYRMAWYVIAILFSLAVMYIIPRKKHWFTFIGQRTISIYILHILIRNILVYEGFFQYLLSIPRVYTLSVFAVCIVIVLISSSSFVFKVFNFLMQHPFFIFKKKLEKNS